MKRQSHKSSCTGDQWNDSEKNCRRTGKVSLNMEWTAFGADEKPEIVCTLRPQRNAALPKPRQISGRSAIHIIDVNINGREFEKHGSSAEYLTVERC